MVDVIEIVRGSPYQFEIIDNNLMNIEVTVPANKDIIEVSEGIKGDIGLSAYEIAVKNGYVGTEKQWLESITPDIHNTYASLYEFPNIGKTNLLYIDTGANKVYRWDGDNSKYFCIGSDYTDISCIDGGMANG